MRLLILVIIMVVFSSEIYSQGCCSGGSGSPIAGGASQGVLNCRQIELGANYQYFKSNKFYTKDKETPKMFDNLNSNYLYLRAAYGVSKDFTMSVESGYFLNKTLVDLNKADKIKSSGIADLILFPRYDIYNHKTDSTKTEITIGLGFKIPLGKHNDSMVIYTDPMGNKYYTTSPPTVQPTNGSNDLIFYTFFFRGYPKKNVRLFANALYIKKGWNSLGQKFGDYANIGLFASTTLLRRIGVTFQAKGEWIGKLQADKNVDMLAFYNIDINSTGGRKVSFVPQISFTQKLFTAYVLSEFPIYQYWNGTQVGSQYLLTFGMSYRFSI